MPSIDDIDLTNLRQQLERCEADAETMSAKVRRLELEKTEERVECAKLVAHLGRKARMAGPPYPTTDDIAAAIMRGERAPAGCEVPPTEVASRKRGRLAYPEDGRPQHG
jgi:septal ring factor EnvC (AmiA/AmiB activator)